MIWQHVATPTPAAVTIRPVNESLQAGDMTVLVNYTERVNDVTQVHVQVINYGAEPAAADVSLGYADDDNTKDSRTNIDDADPQTRRLVPARSSQHRVLRVRDNHDPAKAVQIHLRGNDMITVQP